MGLIDDVVQQDNRQLGQTGFSFLDADTLQKGQGENAKKYRLMGYDSPEVAKIIGGKFKAGTAGGEQATQTIWELANKFGYKHLGFQH